LTCSPRRSLRSTRAPILQLPALLAGVRQCPKAARNARSKPEAKSIDSIDGAEHSAILKCVMAGAQIMGRQQVRDRACDVRHNVSAKRDRIQLQIWSNYQHGAAHISTDDRRRGVHTGGKTAPPDRNRAHAN
jgi:hypothetical protein